tara:strand:+ start:13770 stop:14123 length:354 start_codon:yes stop_codon:yes gene_type:complete
MKIIGCSLGRESDRWVDFNLHGHQVVAHLSPDDCSISKTNYVDGDNIPSRHFGVILARVKWEKLRTKIHDSGVQFLIEPKTRFKGHDAEQSTFFIQDPSGNILEFKSFKNKNAIFKK